MLKMPVGISDFRDLISNGYYFADKTEFLCRLMDCHAQAMLFSRPRGFGRTLTLSMADWFFNMAHREEAKALFKGTHIASADQKYMDQAGTKPVLSLSLKDVTGNTCSAMLSRLSARMAEVYASFGFLADSPKLTDRQRRYYQATVHQTGTEDQLVSALRSLLAMLAAHYGRPVLLLFDEYDAPLQSVRENGEYGRAFSFMRNFLCGALKDNANLDFALLTGTLGFIDESLFGGVNIFEVSSAVSGGYADCFGFTRGEVEHPAKAAGHEAQLAEITGWYGGYNFQGAEMYNPLSVISFFANGCRADPCRAISPADGILTRLLQRTDARFRRDGEALAAGKTVVAHVDENTAYSSSGPGREALYTILLFAGYLKVVRCVDAENDLYELTIPNREIRRLFRSKILSNAGTGQGDAA